MLGKGPTIEKRKSMVMYSSIVVIICAEFAVLDCLHNHLTILYGYKVCFSLDIIRDSVIKPTLVV